MRFNKHSELEGLHAFLSPSKYHWVNYSEEKMDAVYRKALAAERGTQMHEFAATAIKLGVKLPKTKATINAYVNDAIGYRMTPEQPLFYSPNCFGTADAISFRKDLLRIHDLKTGTSPTSLMQLKIYCAIFCLEYDIRPASISYEIRIYQSDEIVQENPEGDEISYIIDRIVFFDKLISELREEVYS